VARPRRSGDTRLRLLDAGVREFTEHGFHGTGVQQVLGQVGVPKGSFYNYFASKEAFGAEAIRHYADGVARAMRDAARGSRDPLSGLRRFFHGLMKQYEAAGFVGGCLVANLGGELEGSDVCRDALGEAFTVWRDSVRDVLRDAQRRGQVRTDIDAREMADLLVDAWEGAVIRMKIDRSLAPLQRCLDRLLDGYFKG
jgi:TetR/AcrR family transcriptional regulator, transcriptional repressor for nem operon